MIVGSSLGYFYFAGLQTFALLFVKGHYHASQATAELVLALLVVGRGVGTRRGRPGRDLMLRARRPGGARVVPRRLLHRRGGLLIAGLARSRPHPRAVVRGRRRGADLRRQPPGPGGAPGRHARPACGAGPERADGRALAGPGLAPLLFGGARELIAGISPQQAPIGTHPHAPPATPPPGCR